MNTRVFWLRISAILGALAILLGAFGAHGLKEILDVEMLAIFETGVRYHFYHTLALLAVCCLSKDRLLPKPLPAICMTWLIGILIFSGSLYILAISGIRWLGAITPIGGVSLIIGWVWLAISSSKIIKN